MADHPSRAERNRAIRQEALREQIQADQLIRQTLVRVTKLDAEGGTMETNQIQAIKAANDASLRLLAKVLPDLKSVELSQDQENPVFTDERQLDSTLSRLFQDVARAEERVAATPSGKGPVH